MMGMDDGRLEMVLMYLMYIPLFRVWVWVW